MKGKVHLTPVEQEAWKAFRATYQGNGHLYVEGYCRGVQTSQHKINQLETKVEKLTEMLKSWNGCNVCKNKGTQKCKESNCGGLELPLFELNLQA